MDWRFLGTLALGVACIASRLAADSQITIDPRKVVHPVSPYLTGACIEDVNHEIYGGLYSQMLFGESFQEPPPPSTIEHFRVYEGSWQAQEGVLRGQGTDGAKLVSDHPQFRDGIVRTQIRFDDRSGQNASLVVRLREPGPGEDKFFGYEVALEPGGQRLMLGRHRDDFQMIDQVPCEVPIGKWIALEVRLSGSVMSILVDDKLVLVHDDGPDTIPEGTVALRLWQASAFFQKLSVTADGKTEDIALQQPPTSREVSGMWRPTAQGTAVGEYQLVKDHPFVGEQSQQISFKSGDGQCGIENRGLNRWGLGLVANQPYEGELWVRTQQPTTLLAALESGDGSKKYAEQSLKVEAGEWRRLALSLTPTAADAQARFALELAAPGSVTVGYARLEPGDWGRFHGLPVRRDVAEGMVAEGLTVVRYGGSMVNEPQYRWKKMIGPRAKRPPYHGTWYSYSSNGWGIPDFMSFAEAAGFAYVPDFNIDESPPDMADFIDYTKAPADSEWGRRRAADGHPSPYGLKYMELGNEERVDERYAQKFEALASAIWARDPKMILVVGDFDYTHPITDPYHFDGADSRITTLAAHQRILRIAKAHDGEVWFDVHVNTERPMPVFDTLVGMLTYSNALDQLAEEARHKVVVFEFNSGNHAQRRALANALALNEVIRDGRTPIVCVANGLQPDGQNDNGWDQGLLFLNPTQVWLQPPGYLEQMLAANREPLLVQSQTSGTTLSVVASRAQDAKTVVVEVVNTANEPVIARVNFADSAFRPTTTVLTTLQGEANSVNTARTPLAITPRSETQDVGQTYRFPARSITILRFR